MPRKTKEGFTVRVGDILLLTSLRVGVVVQITDVVEIRSNLPLHAHRRSDTASQDSGHDIHVQIVNTTERATVRFEDIKVCYSHAWHRVEEE